MHVLDKQHVDGVQIMLSIQMEELLEKIAQDLIQMEEKNHSFVVELSHLIHVIQSQKPMNVNQGLRLFFFFFYFWSSFNFFFLLSFALTCSGHKNVLNQDQDLDLILIHVISHVEDHYLLHKT